MMLWALRRRIFEKTQTYSNQQTLHGFKLTDDFRKHFEHFETKNIMGGYYDTTGLLFNASEIKALFETSSFGSIQFVLGTFILNNVLHMDLSPKF